MRIWYLVDKRDFYKHTLHVNSSLPGLVGGGGSQVRGADPKGVKVTRGVWISDFYVICYVSRVGVNTRAGYRIGSWGGGVGKKLIQSSLLLATAKKAKQNKVNNNLILWGGGFRGGGAAISLNIRIGDIAKQDKMLKRLAIHAE